MSDAPHVVFIVGFARSGTTLLATLLDRHSEMAATPETHFFSEVVSRQTRPHETHDAAQLTARFLASERIRDLGLTLDDFSELLDRGTCTWKELFTHALARYANRHHASIVVEKTPAHMTKIPQIFEWYPDAKIIHIIRDGRDTALSLLQVPWTHTNLRRHARTWRWCMKRAGQFRRRYPQQILEVRYETLLSNPEDVGRTVCRYIGVAYEPGQLQPGEGDRAIPKWESEWKTKASRQLDPSRIQAWKRTATPSQRWTMNSMMGGVLREYGYDDTALGDCPAVVRLGNGVANAIFLVLYHPWIKPLFVAIKRSLRLAGVPTDRIDRPRRADE